MQREDELGEMHTFEDKSAVENELANYFTNIYKILEYRRSARRHINFNVDDSEKMQINTTRRDNATSFTLEEVMEEAKRSHLNKGLAPDYFDGNVLHSIMHLND